MSMKNDEEKDAAGNSDIDDVHDGTECYSDEEFRPTPSTSRRQPHTTVECKTRSEKMSAHLPALVAACDRTGVSDRAAAMLASAVLQDMKMVSPNERSKVIDRSKIRRERTKVRKALAADINEIEGLYFDGRKDKTMRIVRGVDKKYHRKKVVEEHVSIISEPGSLYFSHVVPNDGTSNAIIQAILDNLEEKNVDLAEIKVIGCDGINVNTGHARGVIRLLEVSLQRPLQWLVCLLHSNELPLRHLFLHLDGATIGPLGFYGPIGKALNSCMELAVVEFEPVQLSLCLL